MLIVANILASEELIGHIVEYTIVEGCGPDLLVAARPSLRVAHGAEHSLREVGHHGQQLLLLKFAQHAVYIEVEHLQIKIGGHETGEVLVVVLLIHLEQLVVQGRHDGEAVLCQLLTQLLIKVLDLFGIRQVRHVHT